MKICSGISNKCHQTTNCSVRWRYSMIDVSWYNLLNTTTTTISPVCSPKKTLTSAKRANKKNTQKPLCKNHESFVMVCVCIVCVFKDSCNFWNFQDSCIFRRNHAQPLHCSGYLLYVYISGNSGNFLNVYLTVLFPCLYHQNYITFIFSSVPHTFTLSYLMVNVFRSFVQFSHENFPFFHEPSNFSVQTKNHKTVYIFESIYLGVELRVPVTFSLSL